MTCIEGGIESGHMTSRDLYSSASCNRSNIRIGGVSPASIEMVVVFHR